MTRSGVPSTSDVLHALGLVSFERAGSAFHRVGDVDPAFALSFPAATTTEVDLPEIFPFLEVFQEQAEALWAERAVGSVSSPSWSQRDANGVDIELRAIAAYIDSRELLMIESKGVRVDERQTLQRAREARLVHEQLERTTDALEESEKRYRALTMDLENRVEERTSELRRLASQLVDAEREERRRIAKGLHDRLGQSLAVVKLGLSSLQAEANLSGSFVPQVLDSIDSAIGYTRDLTFELGSPVLYELGLAPALEELGRRVSERAGFTVEVSIDEPAPVSENSSVLLYESVRELLHNCEKHSLAECVTVSSRIQAGDDDGEFFVIVVHDDGCGFDPESVGTESVKDGFGLHSLKERLEYSGGACSIVSFPSGGTTVELSVVTATSTTARRRSS